MTDLKKDQIAGVRVIVAIAIVLILVVLGYKGIEAARGAVPPRCPPATGPNPPLVLQLRDGTQIAAVSLRYDLTNRIVYVEDADGRLFCNGYEDN